MDTQDAATSDGGRYEARIVRLKVRLLLLIPWPMLYLGYWSLYHVKGPASEGFGMGTYASGLITMVYGISLYALNRSVVYSRLIPQARSADRALYAVARVLFIAGILGLIPMLFFLMIGFPFSLLGIILIAVALFRWKPVANESELKTFIADR